MKLFLSCSLVSTVLFLIGGVYPLESVAQSITNGYICAPKNPGGEETRLYFRQQDGVAINLSQSATFPVVCPVIIAFDAPPYFAGVDFRNGSSVTQKFSCALEEYDFTATLVRTTGKAISVPANGASSIVYENYYLDSFANYLSLRCIIPPRGMIATVGWF